MLHARSQKLPKRVTSTLPTYLYFISDGDIIYNFITLFKFQHSISILAEQQRIVSKLEQLMQLCSELEKNINQSKKEETNLLLQTVLREALEEKEN
ncbi:MAG: hypothetical protein WC209_01340 [Ignavibacteriaceae bacterium]